MLHLKCGGDANLCWLKARAQHGRKHNKDIRQSLLHAPIMPLKERPQQTAFAQSDANRSG